MTSVLNVDSIAAKDGTSPVALTKQHAAKAWLKFNGNTPAITDSFNISSASDVGGGEATHVFINNMANNTFVYAGMGGYSDFVQSGGAGNTSRNNATPDTTSTVTLLNSNYNFTRIDTANMNSVEFGDLA
jgi:hypothetical protein